MWSTRFYAAVTLGMKFFKRRRRKKNSDKKKTHWGKKTIFLIEVILVLHTLVYHLLLILRAKYP